MPTLDDLRKPYDDRVSGTSQKRVLVLDASARRAAHAMVERLRRKVCENAALAKRTGEDLKSGKGPLWFGSSDDSGTDDRTGVRNLRSSTEQGHDPRDSD